METIKVNMSPNPLDVQTIHASQNDGEARQWEFELHNNGELIDTSDITEQLFFKAYKGGTEQLLPENGSTPTTSPFLGDIKYPQGLRFQEFAYRQSPTESDGLAFVEKIKGNTLVWNQLINPSSFSYGTLSGITTSASGTGGIHIEGTATATAILAITTINTTANHKYLLLISKTAINGLTVLDNSSPRQFDGVTTSVMFTSSGANINAKLRVANGTSINVTVYPMLFDLTQMGLDSIVDPSEFISLFPLSYYSYNQGSLLSFNGNGIKTVGKNQLNPSVFDYDAVYEYSDGNLTVKSSDRRTWTALSTFHLKKGSYIFIRSVPNGICDIRFGYENFETSHLIANQLPSYPFTVTQDTDVKIKVGYSYSAYPFTTNVMIRFADTDSIFEPYTSSTLSLPTSTYFPTGMKSAGNVYDELTESKAITRIGVVDLGTLTWTYDASTPRFYTQGISSIIKKPLSNNDIANITSVYEATSLNGLYGQSIDKCIAVSNGGVVSVKDTSYSDLNAFRTAMNGVYLYYELATETETPITTASLVTENAEIPLSNEDGILIGKCTEQLSENPGFIDAKIKLADSDGECYSNKIQLHIERSPQ